MPDNQIGLEAIFDNTDFQRGIDDYNRAVSDADENTADAGTSMSDIWNGLATVGAAAFTAIAIVIGSMTAALYDSVSAAIDAEDAMARVNFVVAGTADRTGVTTDEVNDLAGALSKVLPIDDEVIAGAIAMGLTFDGVNQDNIEPLIGAAADLAAWTGGDLPSAMKNLSLAITDPDRAMRLLKEANITLTDEQKKTLKALGDTGDTAGTTTFLLDQLAQKGIIGLGEAMGDTTKGKFSIMQTAIGNLQESLGEGLLNSFGDVIDIIADFANNPATIEFFTDLGETIGSLAGYFIAVVQDGDTLNDFLSHLPAGIQPVVQGIGEFVAVAIEEIPKAFRWFIDNKPLIVGILAAIGAALVAFGITAATTAIATISAFAPIILTIGIIGAAAALLFTAWTENWGGIQEATAQVWAVVQPIFETLKAWLGKNIPVALAYLGNLWTTVLLPAIQAVFKWISSTLIPLWISLAQWLQVTIPAAIRTLVNYWMTVLLPALQAVWNWISTNLFPLFEALAELLDAVVGFAVTVLAGLWQNVLLPAIQAVGDWIQGNLVPIFESIAGVINNTVMPAVQPFAEFLDNVLRVAFEHITDAIHDLIDWIHDLTDAFTEVELPDWLQPGSPTPFELGLIGINKQLKQLASAALPAVTQQMNILAQVRDVPGANSSIGASVVSNSSVTRNYLFGAQFHLPSPSGLIETLQGL